MKFFFPLFALLGLGLFSVALAPEGRLFEENSETYTLLFTGDIMLDRGVDLRMRKQEDWSWPFRKAAPALQQADFLFGNLESVISDKGTKVGSIYSFRAKPEAMEGLAFAGFDAVSVANNHSMDYTAQALQDSIERLEEAGIMPVGGGLKPDLAAQTFELGELKLGLLAYTASGSPLWQAKETEIGIAWLDEGGLEEFLQSIEEAAQTNDLVIVSLHFGDEYAPEPNGFQRTAAKAAIRAGADLIIGHHPHVAQPLEQYRHGWIAYSLGNFVFDQDFSEETMRGAVLRVIVKNKSIVEAELIPTMLTDDLQAVLYPAR